MDPFTMTSAQLVTAAVLGVFFGFLSNVLAYYLMPRIDRIRSRYSERLRRRRGEDREHLEATVRTMLADPVSALHLKIDLHTSLIRVAALGLTTLAAVPFMRDASYAAARSFVTVLSVVLVWYLFGLEMIAFEWLRYFRLRRLWKAYSAETNNPATEYLRWVRRQES